MDNSYFAPAPMVSVVIPVYNVQDYLGECLDSVLSQDLAELEVLCADDCSTDSSPQILREYAARDSRVVPIFGEENHGAAYARNMCIQKARGKYIYFLDADDMLKPGALKEIVAAMEQDDLDGVLFNGEAIFETPELKAKWGDAGYYSKKHTYEGIMPGYKLYAEILSHEDYSPSVFLQMWRRDLLTDNNISFNANMPQMDDELFYFQIMMFAKRMRCLTGFYHLYRRRDGSITTMAVNEKKKINSLRCLIMLLNGRLKTLDEQKANIEPRYLRYLYSSLVFALFNVVRLAYDEVSDPFAVRFDDLCLQNYYMRFMQLQTARKILPFMGKRQPVFMGDEKYRENIMIIFDIPATDYIVLDEESDDGKRFIRERRVMESIRQNAVNIIFSDGYPSMVKWLTRNNFMTEGKDFIDGRGISPLF